jgi:hypothetical protein
MIGTIPQPIAGEYAAKPTPAVRDLVGIALKKLFPNPLAVVAGSHDVDVSIMRTRKGKLAIHLVNTSGPHRGAVLIPSIEPVGPLSVTIRSETKPKSVVLEPEGRSCNFRYENGEIHASIDTVKLHEIIVVD